MFSLKNLHYTVLANKKWLKNLSINDQKIKFCQTHALTPEQLDKELARFTIDNKPLTFADLFQIEADSLESKIGKVSYTKPFITLAMEPEDIQKRNKKRKRQDDEFSISEIHQIVQQLKNQNSELDVKSVEDHFALTYDISREKLKESLALFSFIEKKQPLTIMHLINVNVQLLPELIIGDFHQSMGIKKQKINSSNDDGLRQSHDKDAQRKFQKK